MGGISLGSPEDQASQVPASLGPTRRSGVTLKVHPVPSRTAISEGNVVNIRSAGLSGDMVVIVSDGKTSGRDFWRVASTGCRTTR
jgi:hypothetical protein